MAWKFGGLLKATKQQSILQHDLYGIPLIIFINIVHWDASNGGPSDLLGKKLCFFFENEHLTILCF
jgi:hypothetical protein